MTSQEQITNTWNELFNDSKYDLINIAKDAYFSISREQGEDLVQRIT